MLPESLKVLPRWVNWTKKLPHGKVPLQHCDKPETWLTFDEAKARTSVEPFIGLGIQLGPPIVGVDLDWKEDESSVPFETIPPYARDIIRRLNSYTEWSPSGRGCHILCSGKIDKPIKTKNIEVYGEGRFFTVTGRAIHDAAVTPYHDLSSFTDKKPDTLSSFTDKKPDTDLVPAGMRNNDLATEAGRILQRNEVSSPEELIERLQVYARHHHVDGDPEDPKLESIGRRFWDKYKLDGTLAEISFMPADEFTARSFPPRSPIAATIEGTPILTAYSLNQVFAFRGTGKTLFQMAWAIAMSRGEDFLCYTHPEPVTVGYIEGELPNTVVQERLNMLRGSKPLPNLRLFTRDQMPQGFYLDSEANRNVLSAAVKSNGIKVLFLDSSQSLITKPENDQETWIGLTNWLINLRTEGCCVVLTRQTGKDQSRGARGHSAAEDLLDVAIQLTQLDPGRGYLNCKLEYTKFRGAGDIRPVHIEKRVGAGWTYTEVDEEIAAEARDLKAGGMSIADIAKELGIRRDRVSKMVRDRGTESVPEPVLF